MSIDVNNMAAEIAQALTEYDQEVSDRVKKIVDAESKEAVKQLKETSPKRTGAYAKSWRQKNSFEDSRTKRNTVYNKDYYQLTHLLEYGHASRKGGRVKAIEHIAPIEQRIAERIQKQIEQEI